MLKSREFTDFGFWDYKTSILRSYRKIENFLKRKLWEFEEQTLGFLVILHETV
jgi:hypothetical protein